MRWWNIIDQKNSLDKEMYEFVNDIFSKKIDDIQSLGDVTEILLSELLSSPFSNDVKSSAKENLEKIAVSIVDDNEIHNALISCLSWYEKWWNCLWPHQTHVVCVFSNIILGKISIDSYQ